MKNTGSKQDKSGNTKVVLIVLVSVVALVILLSLLVGIGYYILNKPAPNYNVSYSGELKKFSSLEDMQSFVKQSQDLGYNSYYSEGRTFFQGFNFFTKGTVAAPGVNMAMDSAGTGESASTDYSQTNIQVEGVDEADMVKNDGKYIYTVNGQNVVITQAYPASDMKVVGKIDLNKSIGNIFLNGDRLVLFAQDYEREPILYNKVSEAFCGEGGCGGYDSKSFTVVYVYDVSDREKPVLEKNYSLEGNYLNSRMIGDYVYVLSQKSVYQNVEPPIYRINGVESTIAPNDVYYFDYLDNSYVFTSISAIELGGDKFSTQVYLTGYTSTVYVSQENIYLAHEKTMSYTQYSDLLIREVYLDIAPESLKVQINSIVNSDKPGYEKISSVKKLIGDYSNSLSGTEKSEFDTKLMNSLDNFEKEIAKKQQMTGVHKIAIDKDKIEYKANGEFPGYILNQFSMDEYNGNFRVATTTGEVWSGNSLNHLYILNKDLEVVGKVEDLAKGEKVYSARFLGDRAYIVTFKKIDPLFVIDVSNPQDPQVLGYLKISGFSDYLHPYDENHVIGIGKEARGGNEQFAWYQGVKVALFDVTNVSNPLEVGKIEIGDRGTDSPALNDHKAVLFDKERNLLVLPITLAEINKTKYRNCSAEETRDYRSYDYCLTDNTYGEPVWQGAYVLNVNLDGISLRGKITHKEDYAGPTYGPAENEPIGAIRADDQGRVWTKTNITHYEYSTYRYGQWRTNAAGYERMTYSDYEIDNFPGGVNYLQNRIYDYKTQIQRSLYMDDMLYTVSLGKIKANKLSDLTEVSRVDLPYNEGYYGYYGDMPMAI
ncbi:MAG: beta-propeller domain-containing protein [Candidatus Pacearchaeota archaeon]|jgi:uncharacterized secreted protein with C-terminal beta-propeller domain